MQVAPLKPMLKPPGSKHSKLKCDILLSTLAFKFNLRRYTTGMVAAFVQLWRHEVRRCRLTL